MLELDGEAQIMEAPVRSAFSEGDCKTISRHDVYEITSFNVSFSFSEKKSD